MMRVMHGYLHAQLEIPDKKGFPRRQPQCHPAHGNSSHGLPVGPKFSKGAAPRRRALRACAAHAPTVQLLTRLLKCLSDKPTIHKIPSLPNWHWVLPFACALKVFWEELGDSLYMVRPTHRPGEPCRRRLTHRRRLSCMKVSNEPGSGVQAAQGSTASRCQHTS